MKKILIVEDGLIIAFHLQKLLEKNGYVILDKIKFAEEAVDKVKKTSPDLILLDIMLEGNMTGIECAAELRKFTDTPIIFMSALTDQDTVNTTSEIANSSQVNKPFEEDHLLKKIERLLSQN